MTPTHNENITDSCLTVLEDFDNPTKEVKDGIIMLMLETLLLDE